MAKKNVVESAKAGNFPSSPGSSHLTISDIPQPLSRARGFKHIAPDDEILQDGHHKEILSDADVPQAALASSDLALTTSEPPMMLAMAEGAGAGAATGGGAAVGGGAAAGGAGLGIGAWLLGGAAVVGGGAWVHAETQHSNDTLYVPIANNTDNGALHVVVEKSGAYIDANANGVLDGEESCHAADFSSGGSADLAAHNVVVHFNDAPDTPLDLTGFGSDDLIELDVTAFAGGALADHGYGFFQQCLTSNAVSVAAEGPSSWRAGFSNFTLNRNSSQFPEFRAGGKGSELTLGNWSSNTTTTTGTISAPVKNVHTYTNQLLASNLHLADAANQIHLVNFFEPVTNNVSVVVEHGGFAYIDTDGDGFLDASENYSTNIADFGSGGNADLTANEVTIHFNGIPGDGGGSGGHAPLNLANFDFNDKVEIDIAQFQHNVFVTAQGFGMFADMEQLGSSLLGPYMNNLTAWDRHFGLSLSGSATWTGNFGNGIFKGPVVNPAEFTGPSGHLPTVQMRFNTAITGFSGLGSGMGNSSSISMKGWVMGSGSEGSSGLIPIGIAHVGTKVRLAIDGASATNSSAVFDHLLATGLNMEAANHGQISMVDAALVYGVDATGAWLDRNENGLRDGGNEIAISSGGTIDASQQTVVFHVYDTPDTPINVTGFGLDDRIILDASALLDQTTASGGYKFSGARAGGFFATSASASSVASWSAVYTGNTGTTRAFGANREEGSLLLWTYAGGSVHSNKIFSLQNPAAGFEAGSGNLHTVVDYINSQVHVVVDQGSAYLDLNKDGVLNAEDYEFSGCCSAPVPAVFSSGGNADLADHAVTIHFNSAPDGSLDLTGFSPNDRIELDVTAFLKNSWNPMASSRGASSSFDFNNFNAPSDVNIESGNSLKFLSRASAETTLSNSSIDGWLAQFGPTTLETIGSNGYIYNPGWYIENGSLKEFYGHSYSSFSSSNVNHLHSGTLAHGLGSSVNFASQVSLVNFNLQVVVDSNGAFMDTNSDGVHQASETAVASFSGGGNADLSFNHVTVHYNELPATPINLSGFGEDDRIEIDLDAINFGMMNVPRNNQSTIGHTHGTSSLGNTGAYLPSSPRFAVFTSGNSLKYGMLSSYQTISGSTTIGSTPTASGSTPIMGPRWTTRTGFVTQSGGGVLATNLSGAYVQQSQILNQVDFLATFIV